MENKFLNVNFNGPFVHADIFFSSFRPSPAMWAKRNMSKNLWQNVNRKLLNGKEKKASKT